MKRALITGITGQDGSYLAELLLTKGYDVHGIIRRVSSVHTGRIEHLFNDVQEMDVPLHLHDGDLTDASSVRSIVEEIQPDEVYNLGAQSHVRVSFSEPCHTADSVGFGALGLFEAIHKYSIRSGHEVRVYQAGSSEMYGSTPPPQNESTPFHPRSPYAVAKLAAHWFAINYRESYGMFICNGILFNHESPRRGETFVTRKITRALGRIKVGLQKQLFLGNLDAKRDWGFAGDYVEAMWLMLQQELPDDYVVATGEAWSVRDFLNEAAGVLGLDWEQYVKIDPRYFRPAEVDYLLGDSTKMQTKLGWKPRVSFPELVRMMVEHDLELAHREKAGVDDSAARAIAGRK